MAITAGGSAISEKMPGSVGCCGHLIIFRKKGLVPVARPALRASWFQHKEANAGFRKKNAPAIEPGHADVPDEITF